jgi:hypothetical protein
VPTGAGGANGTPAVTLRPMTRSATARPLCTC